MRRGRPPTPTVLRVLRGNPGKRPLNQDEATCTPASLDPPTWLEGAALEKWNATAPDLLAAGLLADIDRDALLAYCEAWARWRDAEQHIKQYGVVISSPNGYPIQSPYVAIADRAQAKMAAFQSEFGMTPSARSRVHVRNGGAKDPKKSRLARFLADQARARKSG